MSPEIVFLLEVVVNMIKFASTKLILTAVLLVSFSACSNEGLPSGHRGESFKLANLDQQRNVLNIMAKESIPYKVDERGFVHYLLDDQAEVHGIMRGAKYGEKLSNKIVESKIFIDTSFIDAYKNALDDKKIPYSIRQERGHTALEWVQLYGPEVDIIIESVDKMVLDKIVDE